MRRFLTAEWRDLIMANYEVSPELLDDLIPSGTEIDLHDGRCLVSLVGFMFLRTRVLGVPIPGHINFEEVNLRFYLKREADDETRRGVCFIKEIVPRRAIAVVARKLYGEPYERWRMSNDRSETLAEYTWSRNGKVNRIRAELGQSLGVPMKVHTESSSSSTTGDIRDEVPREQTNTESSIRSGNSVRLHRARSM